MSAWLPGTFGPKGDPIVNLFTNPSLETAVGLVEVRRNLHTMPTVASAGSDGIAVGSTAYVVGGAAGAFAAEAGWQAMKPTSIPAGGRFGTRRTLSGAAFAVGEKIRVHVRFRETAPAGLRWRVYVDPIPGGGNIGTWVSTGAPIDEQVTIGANITGVQFHVWLEPVSGAWSGTASAAASWFMVEKNSPGGPAFYGGGSLTALSPDLTTSWVDVPNASDSIITGVRVAGTTAGWQSTQWAAVGTKSLYVPAGTGQPFALSARTLLATPRFPTQTVLVEGALQPAGEQVRITGPAAVELGEGWWDCIGLVAGAYTGPWFHGDSPNSDEWTHAWTGPRDASTSTRQEMEPVMATIYGTLSDFGLDALTPYMPVVRFTPSGAGVKGKRLFAERPVDATVSSNGDFAVLLEPTDGVTPPVWYTVSIEYLNEGGRYTSYDVLGYKLRVPAPGGAIGELPDVPLSPDTVLVSLDPPPPGYKGWYLNAPGPGNPPGDPDDPATSGTGVLEIVS
ncbi:hypothetical protein [Microbacterium algeriense]|uniref:hypothetical protein n=1 Tax=Microbacterium algeriense TaxID=2615184 RepID=UPI003D75A848